MAVSLVFNDCSVAPPAQSAADAVNRLRILIDVIRTASRRGCERALRVREEFLYSDICSGKNILQWISSGALDEVESEFLRDLVATVSYISGDEISPDYEFQIKGNAALALGVAYATSGIAVSFASAGIWNVSYVKFEMLNVDDHADIVISDVSVRNASTVEHLDSHAVWLSSRGNIRPRSEEAAGNAIIDEVARLGMTRLYRFAFGGDFLLSVARNGFFSEHGLRHILVETCARILVGKEKNDLSEWITIPPYAGWKAYRTHVTKAGPGYRLMLWRRADDVLIFANVGPKFEEYISEEVPEELCIWPK